MTKGERLKMNCFISYRSCVGYAVHVPLLTTRNGIARLNGLTRTLLRMLRTLPDKDKLDWKSHVNKVVHAYN